MAVYISDLLGLLSGVALFIPALRDQLRRLQERRLVGGVEASSSIGKLAKKMAGAQKRQREGFSGFDLTLIMIGAALLVFSYGLKIILPPT